VVSPRIEEDREIVLVILSFHSLGSTSHVISTEHKRIAQLEFMKSLVKEERQDCIFGLSFLEKVAKLLAKYAPPHSCRMKLGRILVTEEIFNKMSSFICCQTCL